MYELNIPKARVACLIGKNGETRKLIERSTQTRLRVSSEGYIQIDGGGYEGYVCEMVVKAIGRGFNPLIALQLVQDNYALEIIEIKEVAGNKPHKLVRIKSRLIGERGKARRVIERLTHCNVCVYGKTVSIIGEYDKLNVAFRGIQKLLHGSPHGHVFGFLEKEMKKMRVV